MGAETRIAVAHALRLQHVDADAEDHVRAASISAFISPHRRGQPIEQRPRDDRVPDVELDDLRDRRYRRDIVIVQPVAGVNLKTPAGRQPRRVAQPLELACLRRAAAVGIRPGMQLDHRHARRDRGLDLRRAAASMNSATRMPAAPSRAQRLAQRLAGADHVQAALGGELGAPLRHQAAIGGPHARRRIRSSPAVAAISRFMRVLIRPAQQLHVALLDVAAILAQMQRDVVGAGAARPAARPAPAPDSACAAAGAGSRCDRC